MMKKRPSGTDGERLGVDRTRSNKIEQDALASKKRTVIKGEIND